MKDYIEYQKAIEEIDKQYRRERRRILIVMVLSILLAFGLLAYLAVAK